MLDEESGKIGYHYGFYAATHAEYHAFREVLDFLQEQKEGIMVGAFERVFHKELTAAKNDGITIGEERGEKRGITIGEKRGITIGEKRGEARGIIKGFAALIRDGILTLRDAASRANMTEDEFSAQMAALGY